MELKEIEQIIKDSDFYSCSLWSNDECIESWNKEGRALEKFERIKKRLNSQPAGNYEIWCRNSVRGKIDKFPFEKTDGKPAPALSENINPKWLENKAYLDLAIANAELKKDTEIQALKNEISSLKEYIKELEDQISEIDIEAETFTLGEEQKAPTLMENAKEFLSSLMEFGAPLLDKHFQLKEQALQLEALKIANRQTSAPGPAQQPAQDPNVKAKKILQWIRSKHVDGELHSQLMDIYSNVNTVNEFMEKVNELDQNLGNELRNEI